MAIEITCGSCGRRFRVKDSARGRQGKCPACGQPVVAEGQRVPDHDVFISYAQKDKNAAVAVCAAIEAKGMRCWMAPRDVAAGTSWGGAIMDAIGESRAMVLIYSSHSNRSKQVLRELTAAVDNDLTVIPFRIEDIEMSKDFKYYLGPLHWLDALTPPLEGHIQELLDRLRRLLAEEGRAARPASSASAVPASASPPATESAATAVPAQGALMRRMAHLFSKRTMTLAAVALAVVAVVFLLAFIWPRGRHDGSSAPAVPAASQEQAHEKEAQERQRATAPEGPSAEQRQAHEKEAQEQQRATAPDGQIARTLDLGGGVTLDMVWCPPGTFMMGSPPDEEGRSADETQHEVTLTQGFWLGKYEVTQKQWVAVMGDNPSSIGGDVERPVEGVSWEACQEFIRKLNTRESGSEFRLPTEAEWEYACRAGSTTAYCFGDNESELGEYAWFIQNCNSETHPVGQGKPNAWGLYDMHGSVYEWCVDWYVDYPARAVTDPQGRSLGSLRVFRGGSWVGFSASCRSACRSGSTPEFRSNNSGFRVALSPGQ